LQYHNQEIKSFGYIAKLMILNQLIELEDRIHESEFNNLDIRSPIAQKILKEELGIEISQLESHEFLTTLKFEIGKVMAKLESATGVDTGLVIRNSQGSIYKHGYSQVVDKELRAKH